jgi:hypothetical protein
MNFDFTGRITAAFGIAAAAAMAAAAFGLNKAFNQIPGARPNVSVYLPDKSKFDNVILWRDENGESIIYNFDWANLTEDVMGVVASPPLISLKRAKKLIITPIDNSDIEVVERYSTEPYDIEWKGLLIDMDNHEFPKSKLEEIHNIFEHNGVWNVSSEIMNTVGIQSLFVQDLSFEFVEGYPDTISYNFKMRAIKPLEYSLIQ